MFLSGASIFHRIVRVFCVIFGGKTMKFCASKYKNNSEHETFELNLIYRSARLFGTNKYIKNALRFSSRF